MDGVNIQSGISSHPPHPDALDSPTRQTDRAVASVMRERASATKHHYHQEQLVPAMVSNNPLPPWTPSDAKGLSGMYGEYHRGGGRPIVAEKVNTTLESMCIFSMTDDDGIAQHEVSFPRCLLAIETNRGRSSCSAWLSLPGASICKVFFSLIKLARFP